MSQDTAIFPPQPPRPRPDVPLFPFHPRRSDTSLRVVVEVVRDGCSSYRPGTLPSCGTGHGQSLESRDTISTSRLILSPTSRRPPTTPRPRAFLRPPPPPPHGSGFRMSPTTSSLYSCITHRHDHLNLSPRGSVLGSRDSRGTPSSCRGCHFPTPATHPCVS